MVSRTELEVTMLDVSTLRSMLTGDVITPDDPCYDDARAWPN